jgi:heterotetrameric sarcosine oxidase gamma subunit
MADLVAVVADFPALEGITPCNWDVLSIRRIDGHGTASPDVSPINANLSTGSVAGAGALLVASLVPGEWLVTGSPAEVRAVALGNAGAGGLLLADLTHGRLVLDCQADAARRALAAYSPIDPARSLVPGRAAATRFADIDALFLAPDEKRMIMVIEISLAAYLAELLGALAAR